MNIFIVHPDPIRAALSLCDDHVVKMPLESAQIVCTILHAQGCKNVPYKPTHQKHPAVLWAAASARNFMWLYDHGIALCDEYERRFGRVHASRVVLVEAGAEEMHFPKRGRTPFVQCMPEELRIPGDAVAAYRGYYRYKLREKPYLDKWSPPGRRPLWIGELHG